MCKFSAHFALGTATYERTNRYETRGVVAHNRDPPPAFTTVVFGSALDQADDDADQQSCSETST